MLSAMIMHARPSLTFSIWRRAARAVLRLFESDEDKSAEDENYEESLKLILPVRLHDS